MNLATAPSKADALRLIARGFAALADAEDAAPTNVPDRPRYYSASSLPPGAASWRAARETAAREGLALVRVGRDALIVADAWDALLEQRTVRRATATAVAPASSDAAALEAMGLLLVGSGGRR